MRSGPGRSRAHGVRVVRGRGRPAPRASVRHGPLGRRGGRSPSCRACALRTCTVGARGAEVCRHGMTSDTRYPSHGGRSQGQLAFAHWRPGRPVPGKNAGDLVPAACHFTAPPASPDLHPKSAVQARNAGIRRCQPVRSGETRPPMRTGGGHRHRRDTGDIHPKVATNRKRESPCLIARFSIPAEGVVSEFTSYLTHESGDR
jgi:hypothetical protein